MAPRLQTTSGLAEAEPHASVLQPEPHSARIYTLYLYQNVTSHPTAVSYKHSCQKSFSLEPFVAEGWGEKSVSLPCKGWGGGDNVQLGSVPSPKFRKGFSLGTARAGQLLRGTWGWLWFLPLLSVSGLEAGPGAVGKARGGPVLLGMLAGPAAAPLEPGFNCSSETS